MVSDSKDITPRTIRAHNIAANAITTAKVGKKIIHTASADPTTAADAGTGYEVGSLWNNTSSGEIFVCTDSSEEDCTFNNYMCFLVSSFKTQDYPFLDFLLIYI